jgi:beta-phosphoglucomutase-like phosphatase (HAD superfamily)
VFETTPAGIEAARVGGFGLVVGVARGDDAQALHDAGAHIVVSGLEELFERERAA